MRSHLTAVPMSQAPGIIARVRNAQMSSYYNNYPFAVNNQQYYINRQNTRYYAVNQGNYPDWYQPGGNWSFCNGFMLGSAINIGMDWLGSDWQPDYGHSQSGSFAPMTSLPLHGCMSPPQISGGSPA